MTDEKSVTSLAHVIQIADAKDDPKTMEDAALEILGIARRRKSEGDRASDDRQEAQP